MPGTATETTSGGNRSTYYGFDAAFFKRIFHLHRILFPGFLSYNFLLFGLLITVCGLEQYLAYQVGLLSGTFYKVLGERNWDGFKSHTLYSLGIIAFMTAVKSVAVFVTRCLTVTWRKCLNLAMHKLYFTSIRYYQLNVLDASNLDNCDQRLTADISLFCSTYGGIIADLVVSPFTIGFYCYDAYSRAGWIGPTAMIVFFILSTIVNKLLMSPVVNLTVEQERKEGNFRFKHVSVRTNSESLSFHGCVRVESGKVNSLLLSLCQTQQSIVNRKLILDLATNWFNYFGAILTFMVIAVPIFTGALDDKTTPELAKLISENSFVCMYLAYMFSKLVNMSTTVAGLAGVTHRIAELAEVLAKLPQTYGQFDNRSDDDPPFTRDLSHNSSDESLEREESVQSEAPLMSSPKNNADKITVGDINEDGDTDHCPNSVFFTLKNVSFSTPCKNTELISKLSLNFKIGQSTLIMGRSSAGKSSLLRVLRGLWPHDSGRIHCDSRIKMFFVPQKPFFTNGSLREQVVYPLQVPASAEIKEEETVWLTDLLDELGLGDLIRRVGGSLDKDPNWSWYDVLSPGEMQRLAFIRLFYHRPQVAFLDEATSALSEDVEGLVYQRCVDLNMTLVSVGHRENLKIFHKRLLRIGLENENGGWEVSEI